jgi:hypothetical protein
VPTSDEAELFEQARVALEALQPPDSATRGLVWTPRDAGGLDFADTADLIGTWRGVVSSPEGLVRRPGPVRPGSDTTFLAFRDIGQSVRVDNFVEQAESLMVVNRLVRVGQARRLLSLYEVRSDFYEGPDDPAHRGAMMLEIEGDPARALDGPYWTDRKTRGRLTFTERILQPAASWAEACALHAT